MPRKKTTKPAEPVPERVPELVPVHVLLHRPLLEEVDEFAKRERERGHALFSRSDGIRVLLRRGLKSSESTRGESV